MVPDGTYQRPVSEIKIIRLVEESDLPVRRTLRELQVSRTTFYRWYRRYQRKASRA